MNLEKIKEIFQRLDFDIIVPFKVGHYNQRVDRPHQIPTFNSNNELGILLGLTGRIWPEFKKNIPSNEHPFDTYVEKKINQGIKELNCEVLVKHYHDSNPDYVSFQKLADSIGLAQLGPAHLLIHPVYGPWFSIRSILVFNTSYEQEDYGKIKICDDCTKPCQDVLKEIQNGQTHWRKWLEMRDACPISREYRYSEDEIAYHYTKDKRYLTSNNRTC